jgi:hypothetical protein
MSILQDLMPRIKEAMKAKDQLTLAGLRAIKSEVLKANTASGASGEMNEDEEIKLIQRMVKQRKDAAAIYKEQGREDLYQDEIGQAEVIAQFLPEQMSPEALEEALKAIISAVGAEGPKDMGKVMGMANKQLAGKAEGRAIASAVKQLLAN